MKDSSWEVKWRICWSIFVAFWAIWRLLEWPRINPKESMYGLNFGALWLTATYLGSIWKHLDAHSMDNKNNRQMELAQHFATRHCNIGVLCQMSFQLPFPKTFSILYYIHCFEVGFEGLAGLECLQRWCSWLVGAVFVRSTHGPLWNFTLRRERLESIHNQCEKHIWGIVLTCR